jgi:hypothetical protein
MMVRKRRNQPSHKNITLCILMAVEDNSLLILLYVSMLFFFKPNCDFILVNVYFMTEKKNKIYFFIEGCNYQNIDKE